MSVIYSIQNKRRDGSEGVHGYPVDKDYPLRQRKESEATTWPHPYDVIEDKDDPH
jgi:hypothetical protein